MLFRSVRRQDEGRRVAEAVQRPRVGDHPAAVARDLGIDPVLVDVAVEDFVPIAPARESDPIAVAVERREVDDHQQEAILRSDDPTVKGDDRLYYEVHLRGLSHATVRRFKGSRAASTRREQVAFALTHEVLAKLVEDIAG